jgi:glycosyltransferase involved in cell wall biosynthesis
MKILLLDTRPVRRGAQVFLQELKKQFVSSGVTIYRIFLYQESSFECLPMDQTDLVLDFKDNHWMEKYLFFQPSLFLQLSKQVKQFNPDVILCNGSRTLKYAALVKRFNPAFKAKWVYRVIDSAQYWNRSPMVVWTYKKFIISAMDAAVGVSNKSLQEMKVHYQFKNPSIAIPRAVDIPHFSNFVPDPDLRKSWGIAGESFVVLFLGNFTRQKRPDRFVEVIRTVREKFPQVHGLMVGDGPLKTDTIRIIQQLGLDDAFTFTGYQQDVRPFISICDVLMLTSDTEGMPGVVLEAAAMGRSTISGAVGGVDEFLKSGENGIITPTLEVPSFVDAVEKLLVNKDVLHGMGTAAIDTVASRFAVQEISNHYINFLFNLSQSNSGYSQGVDK